LVNGLFGGPRRWHAMLGLHKPGQWIVIWVRTLERRLNRDKRAAEDLRKRGMVLTIALLGFMVIFGVALIPMLKLPYLGGWGWLIEIILVAFLLSLRQDADFAGELAQKMETNQSEAARDMLAGTAWRNAALLDGHGICRAGVETCAVHFCDRVIAPVFWYALLGLPGLLACRMATLLADTTGYGRDAFGATPFQVNAFIQSIPALLAGLLVAASSGFLPFCHPKMALRVLIQYALDADYRRREVALFGAALNLSLGGPTSVYAQGPWLGGAVAKAFPRDARRAVLLLWFSGFLLFLGLLLALFVA
jgi:adenosylcobinamide-phosphate synthase